MQSSTLPAGWRRIGAAITCLAIVTSALPTASAQAYTESVTKESNSPPYMVFEQNDNSPLKGKLTAYVSIKGKRYRLSMRGGTGSGIASECVKNKGQIPTGFYDPHDDDERSTLAYINNKTWGNSVVRGAVWQLGSKRCIPKPGEKVITRSDLFIHSQGASGWSGNYKSNGCIKINQTDRAQLKKRWKSAYKRSRGMLMVY